MLMLDVPSKPAVTSFFRAEQFINLLTRLLVMQKQKRVVWANYLVA